MTLKNTVGNKFRQTEPYSMMPQLVGIEVRFVCGKITGKRQVVNAFVYCSKCGRGMFEGFPKAPAKAGLRDARFALRLMAGVACR